MILFLYYFIILFFYFDKGQKLINSLKMETPNASVEFMQLELSSLKSVRSFVEAFHKKNLPLKTVVLNAG
jgi:hypothetical protein